MGTRGVDEIRGYISNRSFQVLERSTKNSDTVLERCKEFARSHLAKTRIPEDSVCIAVVGSYGRREALAASDLDILPLWTGDNDGFDAFSESMVEFRKELREQLELDVSEGSDILRTTKLDDLTSAQTIGGSSDNRHLLTQRVLLVTEGAEAGGNFSLRDVKRRVIEAYSGTEETRRTAGGHPLAFCNDVARYYRTVCVDYKSGVETRPDAWSVRNAKLRHSRKFWYFSSILAAGAVGARVHTDHREEFVSGLLQAFSAAPCFRLFEAVRPEARMAAGRIVDRLAWYLQFMSDNNQRDALKKVSYELRQEPIVDGKTNPYLALYNDSRVMHREMLELLDTLDRHQRRLIIDWFLL